MTAVVLLLAGVVIALAWSNGANDNFKGVATLLGSGTCGPRTALVVGTLATLAGSLCAVLLSGRLLAAFSGKGIIPDALVGSPTFVVALGLAAAVTIALATVLALPVSTTHALVGAMAGTGLAAAGVDAVGWGRLGTSFLLPLLVSPVIAWILVAAGYPLLSRLRAFSGVRANSCVCADLESDSKPVGVGRAAAAVALAPSGRFVVRAGDAQSCAAPTGDRLARVHARPVLDAVHYLSASAVSFARGLNDTPKIAALMLVGGAVSPHAAVVLVGGGMAAGAVAHALRVGRTMSHRITPMNPGQGAAANFATSLLVLGASRLGVPVSTTHVSVGALFGLGKATAGLDRSMASRILLSWVVTLPLAFLLGALAWTALGA